MPKKIDYASMFTLRKDGRYCGSYTDDKGRHYVYDRDPEKLWHKLNDPKPEHVVTFREVAERWEKKHREEIEIRTWKNYEPHYRDILAEHGDKPFSEVSALEADADLKAAKARGFSRTVVQTRRSIYNMIWDYAVINKVVNYNPMSSVKIPKGLKAGKRKALTEEETAIVLRSIDLPGGLFALTLICTGLRKSEALSLKWDDLDFKTKLIKIEKSIDYTNGSNPKHKDPKTDNGFREVPIVDILFSALQKESLHKTSEYIFPAPPSNRSGTGGTLMTERAYEGYWDRYCNAAGLIGPDGKHSVTAQNFRHGTATLLFELGVDELTAQKIMGHSSIEITRAIYTDLRNSKKIQSVDSFNYGMSKLLSESRKSL